MTRNEVNTAIADALREHGLWRPPSWFDIRDDQLRAIWNAACEACAEACNERAVDMCDCYWTADICRALKAAL